MGTAIKEMIEGVLSLEKETFLLILINQIKSSLTINNIKRKSINILSLIGLFTSRKTKELIAKRYQKISLTANEGIKNLSISYSKIEENLDLMEKILKRNYSKNTIAVLDYLLYAKGHDEYLFKHSVNVALLSFFIGKWLGYTDKQLYKLIKAALLHDLGKLKIPKEILQKPGKLSVEEFEIIKKHPIYTYEIINEIKGLDNDILRAAVMHHEKIDGTGYPYSLIGKEITEYAKIISIADIFDAMTSERVYHKKKSPIKVLEMFEKNFWGTIDHQITQIFARNMMEFYLGKTVILNNGIIAKIIALNSEEAARPIVETREGIFIDLSIDKSIEIKTIIYEKIR